MAEKDLDEAYHEYLWGEPSSHAFARNAKFVGAKSKVSRTDAIEVLVGRSADLSRYV